MAGITTTTEQEILDGVLKDYARKGYEVLRPEQVPERLRSLDPDVVARRGDELVVIEVSSRATSGTSDQIVRLADEVSAHPGWRFEIVWADDGDPSQPDRMVILSEDEIRKRLDASSRLFEQGERAAAFLLMWSLLEAATRRRLASVDEAPTRTKAPVALLKDLVSYGFIDQDQYHRLLPAASIRNSLAHGGLTIEPDEANFERMRSLVRDLLGTHG